MSFNKDGVWSFDDVIAILLANQNANCVMFYFHLEHIVPLSFVVTHVTIDTVTNTGVGYGVSIHVIPDVVTSFIN